MKAEMLKIAGVKSEKEFYKKYPTEEAFMKAHGKEFKKAKLGKAIPDAQYGCKGESCTMTGEGMRKGTRLDYVGMGGGSGGPEVKVIPEWAEISNPESGYFDKDQLKQLKKEYNTAKGKYQGLDFKTYVAAARDAARTSAQFANPERAKYFDPTTGTLMPNVDPRSIDPYMRFYRSKFPTQSRISAEDVLGVYGGMEGGLSNFEKYANVGYQKPMKQGGQLNKLNQLTNFTNDVDGIIPMAEMGDMIGSYMGGDVVPNAQPIMLNDIYAQNIAQLTGLSEEDARAQAELFQQPNAPVMDWKSAMTDLGKAFSNNNEARKGKKVPKYQNAPQPLPLSSTIPNLSQFTSTLRPMPNIGSVAPTGGIDRSIGGGIMGKFGGVAGIANIAGDILGGIQGLGQERQALINARATKNVSDVVRQAASTRPEQMQRQYLRPEDVLVQPEQMFPSYGVGTNYLSRNGSVVKAEGGMQIGGNLTEIQNTYAPGTLYDDLGYEPLNDSDDVKQYYHGGVHRAQFGDWLSQNAGAIQGIGNLATTALGGNNAGSQLGKGIGTAIGTAIPIPGLGAALGAVGGLAGGLLDQKAKKIKKAQEATQRNVQATSMQQGFQALGAQNAGFVRNGGKFSSFEEGGWVSHDWQPQVITTFGEHKLSDLLKEDPMMDTLRTGGNITQNNMFPTDKYALGGELKTTWGGYAEPISYNPYMPGTGETVMFRGKSHEESDGNGHTGIGVKYGDGGMTDYAEFGSQDADADVEVERGEPATEMIDGETGEKNMVVFGNLMINPASAVHIGDSSAKNKKFKNYIADLGKVEAKQNKVVEKSTDEINDLEVFTPFDKMKLDSLDAMRIGANMKLKDIAVKKSNAAAVQNAINDTAAERMLDADALAKGKIKQDKEAMKQQAKWGKYIEKAQTGKDLPYHPISNPTGYKTTLSQNVIDVIDPKSQAWNKATPRYKGSFSEPWDREGKTKKGFYKEAFEKFKEQKSKGQKPFVPYRLNKNVADVYEAALKDFNEQTSGTPAAKQKTYYTPTSSSSSSAAATTTNRTTAAPATTTTGGGATGSGKGGGKKVVTTKGKTKMTVTPAAPTSRENLPLMTVAGPSAPTTLRGVPELKSVEIPKIGKMKKEKKGVDWMNVANALLPYVRPSDQEAFDYAQVYPEMAAMAMNQLEPVKAQLYRPDLGTPMDISLQDQLNANQADFNALQRQVGYNPAALSALAAQKYSANQRTLGEQFRLNQAEKQRVYEGNRALLNQAQLQNLGILDQQFVRQEEAKSRTKAQGLEAIKSIADKIAKNKLENRTLGIYENLYNYRFDRSGRAINMNPLAQFDVSLGGSGSSSKGGGLAPGLEYTYDASGNIIGTRKSKDEAKTGKKVEKNNRNSNLVKAFKNL